MSYVLKMFGLIKAGQLEKACNFVNLLDIIIVPRTRIFVGYSEPNFLRRL